MTYAYIFILAAKKPPPKQIHMVGKADSVYHLQTQPSSLGPIPKRDMVLN